MKSSVLYDLAAVLVTGVGVLFLVGVYFPILNPGFYLVNFHQQALPSIIHYIIGTPFALLILAGGWRLNRKSEKLRKIGK